MENNKLNFNTREKLLKLIQAKIKEQEKYLLDDNENLQELKNEQIKELKNILIDLDKIKKTKNITYYLLNKLEKEQNEIINRIKNITETL